MVKRKDILKFFKEEGFVLVKGTNHDRLVHPDGRWTTLGRHTEIGNRLFDEMKSRQGSNDLRRGKGAGDASHI